METKYKFNPSLYNTVAKNIRKYRLINNMSIETLSEYSNIKKDYLQKLETVNNLSISIYDLYKISVILNVSIDKFFIEEPTENWLNIIPVC